MEQIIQCRTRSASDRLLSLLQDSPTNKLLYAKEIPEYKKRVQCYYKQIQEMAPLSEQEMNAHLAEESRVSRDDINNHTVEMCFVVLHISLYVSVLYVRLDTLIVAVLGLSKKSNRILNIRLI